jgi:hypothetical protein
MSGMDQFMNFMKNGDKDRRLTPIHISLYTALFYCWRLNDYANFFQISRKTVMSLALIKSTATIISVYPKWLLSDILNTFQRTILQGVAGLD